VDTPELREEMVKYYAEVTNFDSLVGMVRTELEKRNLWENTTFIVCSEQGTQLPFAKWTCYDNGLRTGLVIHWPSLSRAGSVVEPLVSTQDIVPSLVSFLGGALSPGDCDGQSFLSLLQGGSEPIHSYLFGAFTNCRINDNKDRIYPIRSIRDERYSLIYNPNFQNGITSNLSLSQALRMVEDDDFRPSNLNLAGSWVMLKDKDELIESLVHKLHHRPEYELYDLHKDPHELFNLAEEKSYQSIFRRLKSALHSKLSSIGDSDPIATERSYLLQSR